MKWADRIADYVGGETVLAAALFQRCGSAAMIGDEGGMPSGAASELEAPGCPSNTVLAVTHSPAVGTWEPLLTFPAARGTSTS